MDELTLLADKYNSDKGSKYGSKHNFTEIYEKYFKTFKHKNINLLEIGINDGSSLKMWYEYFPNASIYGLDINDKSIFSNERIACGVLDQSKIEHLEYFSQNINLFFDIIIDDGSHHISDQQLTFGYLFPLLNINGLYVIEDLHTSLCDPNTMVYGRPMENNFDKTNTTLHYLLHKPYISSFLTLDQNQYLQDNIQNIEIFDKENLNVPLDYKQRSITSIIFK